MTPKRQTSTTPLFVSHTFVAISRFFLSLCFVAVFAAVSPVSAHETKAGELIIDHPVVRAPLAGRTMTAGYMTIANGGAADRLIAAKADFAGRIELHTHIHDNGVMRMRQIEGVDVGHKQVVEFKSGGLHLMIFDVNETLLPGSYVPITLTFEKAGEITADFVVEKLGAAKKADDKMDHGKMDHGQMHHGH